MASGLGEPMQTHKPRLDPICLGEAKLLVEVELDKPFPKQIALDDKQGNIFLWMLSIHGFQVFVVGVDIWDIRKKDVFFQLSN